MKKIIILLYILSFITFSYAQVGINTTLPSNNASLDVNSQISGTVYGGFLPPRVTITQRDLIPVTAADDGMMLYVSGFSNGDRCLQLFNGSTLAWESIQCFALAITTPGVAFIETMATPAGTPVISAYESANGFDNVSATFSSSSSPESDVRTSSPSFPSIAGASGSGNIFMGTATNNIRNFLIQDIDVTAYASPLTLQVLISKNLVASNGSELTIEYSTNGTTWTNVSVSDLSTASAGWFERVLSTTIPNTIQQIRFSKTAAMEFRIDDIKIIKP